MCTQDVVEAVQKARFAAGWLQRNASLFHDRFDIPAVAGMSDDLAQQWDARAVDSEAITDERNYDTDILRGSRNFEIGHVPQATPTWGQFVVRGQDRR